MAIDPRLPLPAEDRNKPLESDWMRMRRRLDELLRPMLRRLEGTTQKYATTVGDGVAVTYTITHGFNTFDIASVIAFDTAGNMTPFNSVILADENSLEVEFVSPPALNTMRVIVTA